MHENLITIKRGSSSRMETSALNKDRQADENSNKF